jgi:hypothetical protein
MKTDDLISMLSAQVEPVPRRNAWRLLLRAMTIAFPCAVVVMLAAYGLRPDLLQSLGHTVGWAKILVPFSMFALALGAVERLSRPGASVGYAAYSWLVPLAALWIMGLAELQRTAQSERNALLMGSTWESCAFNIALVATPLFVASLWALRRLGPTRPTLTGAMAGLASGAGGASVYALHCPEMDAAFISVWYVFGIMIPVLFGALAGYKLLRW